MAYSFDSKFEAKSLEVLERRLSRVAAEAAKAVKVSNRKHADRLADLIRNETPTGGGSVQHRHPRSKGTARPHGRARHGGMKRAVRARATADSASVVGGMKSVPYYIVNEFGGGVRWTNGRSSHGIPVRARSATLASLGLHGDSGGTSGAAGWFFFPTVRKYLPEIQSDLIRDAEAVIRSELTQSPIAA